MKEERRGWKYRFGEYRFGPECCTPEQKFRKPMDTLMPASTSVFVAGVHASW